MRTKTIIRNDVPLQAQGNPERDVCIEDINQYREYYEDTGDYNNSIRKEDRIVGGG